MNWYIEVWRKFAVFSGRATRPEYWYFVLFNALIGFVLGMIDGMSGDNGVLSGLYCLAVLIPALAVGVRRLHDTGRSGWYLLLGLIPFVGVIVLIVLLAQAGQSEANEYGPPRASSSVPSNPSGATGESWFENGYWWMRDVEGAFFWRRAETDPWTKFESQPPTG